MEKILITTKEFEDGNQCLEFQTEELYGFNGEVISRREGNLYEFFGYDHLQNIISHIKHYSYEGSMTIDNKIYEYDASNRITCEKEIRITSSFANLLWITKYYYLDDKIRSIWTGQFDIHKDEILAHEQTWNSREFDDLGNLTGEKIKAEPFDSHWSERPPEYIKLVHFDYDSKSRLSFQRTTDKSSLHPKITEIRYRYESDNFDRIETISEYDHHTVKKSELTKYFMHEVLVQTEKRTFNSDSIAIEKQIIDIKSTQNNFGDLTYQEIITKCTHQLFQGDKLINTSNKTLKTVKTFQKFKV